MSLAQFDTLRAYLAQHHELYRCFKQLLLSNNDVRAAHYRADVSCSLPDGSTAPAPAVSQVAVTLAASTPTFVSAMPAAFEPVGTAATAEPTADIAPQIAGSHTERGALPGQTPSTAAATPGRVLTENADALASTLDPTEEALHNASVSNYVPQRVAPEPGVPRLSRAEEQRIYSKLLERLTGSSSDQGTTHPAVSCSCCCLWKLLSSDQSSIATYYCDLSVSTLRCLLSTLESSQQ